MRLIKTAIILAIINLTAITVFAQGNNSREQYIKRFQKVAMDEMKLYKIPASITLAQGILESGDGMSRLATKANNHFGIKCSSSWEGEKIYHDDDRRGECFRVYPSPWGSFRDHSKFLAHQKRYAFLFDYKIDDYKSWANGLKKAGYATDRKYPERLIKIIEENQLYRYDEMVLIGDDELIEERIAQGGPLLIQKHPNRLKYVLVRATDTYESIAEESGISIKRLLQYNDKTWDSPLKEGEIIFLERKRSYGKNKYYTVKEGDSMHSIAQKEGIKLKNLYERNKIAFGGQAPVGEILFLRKYKK